MIFWKMKKNQVYRVIQMTLSPRWLLFLMRKSRGDHSLGKVSAESQTQDSLNPTFTEVHSSTLRKLDSLALGEFF